MRPCKMARFLSLFCGWLATLGGTFALYCEDKNCYEILGLESALHSSTPPTDSEIKKAYFKLSMVWHPDKCKEEGCNAQFIEIANAYEILSSPEVRKAYDYFLEHPEAYDHTARYYQAMYAPKIPLWVVAGGFLLIMSAIQWPLAWQMYWWAQGRVKSSDFYKRQAANMLAEGQEAGTDDGVELELTGYPKPVWTDLVIFRVPAIPLRVVYAAYRAIRWVVKYNILKHSYDTSAQIWLTQEECRISESKWKTIPLEQQSVLLGKKLWTAKGMKEEMRSMRMASNQKKRR